MDIEFTVIAQYVLFSLSGTSTVSSMKIAAHRDVCNLIETGCFVLFVGRLAGFAPRNKITAFLIYVPVYRLANVSLLLFLSILLKVVIFLLFKGCR